MSKPAMEYLEKSLSSGRKVSLRARTYEEWEKQEDKRLKMLEGAGMRGEGPLDFMVEVALQGAHKAMREHRLTAWVKDFPKLKGELTLRDIAEIEKTALDLESVEIPLGNSVPGGDGQ